MRIKSSITAGIVASILVSIVIACVAFFILRDMKIELERSRIYDEVITKANALNVLMAALKEGSNPSDLPQILNVHASLNDLLKTMSSMDAPEESLIRQIQKNNEKLGDLLNQLPASSTGGRLVLDKERKEILDSQLWMKVHQISDEIYRLRGMSDSKIVSAQANAGITVFFLLVTFILSNTLISVLSGRKIVQSEESLRKSEARYRSLFDAANVGKSVTLPTGELSVNMAFCEMLGYGPDELINKTWQELTPPEEIAPTSELLAPLLRGEQDAVRFEKRYIHKNGSHVWADVSASMQRDSHGKPLYFVTTLVDITERKRTEEARTASESRFRNFLEKAPLPICHVEKNGTISFRNDRFIEIFGYTRDDVPTLAEWWPRAYPEPDYRQWVMDTWDAAVKRAADKGTDIEPLEYKVTCKNGEQRIVEISGITMGEDFFATFIDLTDRKRAEADVLKERDFSDTVIDSLPGIFYMYNEQRRFLRWNKNFERLSGYPGDEIARMNPLDFFAGPEKKLLDEVISEVFTKGVSEVEADFVSKDGTRTHCYFTGLTIKINSQRYLIGVGIDITDRKQAEEALRDQMNLLATMFVQATDSIVLVNVSNMSFIDFNEAAHTGLGYTREEFSRLYVSDIQAELSAEQITIFSEQVLSGELDIPETRHRHKDGSLRVVSLKMRRINFKGESVISAVWRDITEEKQAESQLRKYHDHLEELVRERTAELEETHHQLEDLYNNAPCGYHSLDTNGVIIHINDTELNWLGYKREEAVGKIKFVDWLTPESLEKFRINFPLFKERGYVNDLEFDLVRKDGSIFPILVSATAVRDEAGKYIMSRTTVIDYATQKRATTELREANLRLQELDRLKSMFIASMSHELRTPLNSIIGFTGIILMGMSGPIPEIQRKQLSMVKNSATHLLALINDVIDVSKIEAGKTELTIEAFDLSELANEVKESFAVAATGKGLELSMKSEGTVEVTSDRRRVKQILVNLVGNAVKFTERGTVSILFAQKAAGVEIRVGDTGIGMERKDMERLFEAFSRIHTQGAPIVEGTGLGLYLSRRLAALLGGEITAESEPGRGSEFTLSLPWKYREEQE